jgi:hypothetical protein
MYKCQCGQQLWVRPPVDSIWNDTHLGLLVPEKGTSDMVYQEKIAPPPALAPDEEQVKLIAESLARDDRWVKNLIDGLAGILREVK